MRSTGPLILDFDATLVDAHSEKSGAAPTYKHGYEFSPLACFLDATNEALAILLRPGNRAPHNVDDHIEVLDLALAQLPVTPKGLDRDHGVAMLAWTDSAGATHQFADALVERGLEFSIGFEMRKATRLAILALPTSALTGLEPGQAIVRSRSREQTNSLILQDVATGRPSPR